MQASDLPRRPIFALDLVGGPILPNYSLKTSEYGLFLGTSLKRETTLWTPTENETDTPQKTETPPTINLP